MGIKQADDALSSIIELAERVDGIHERDYTKALESALPQATREARRYLVANYRESGVKTQSGELLRGIKRAVLSVDKGKGGSYVRVAMPSGKDKAFYVAANSVNYGRVNSKALGGSENKSGAKKRRKLKSSIQKGKRGGRLASAGADLSYDTKSIGKTKAGSAKVDTTLGSATVTKAFDFYKLKEAQRKKIQNTLLTGAQEYLEEKLSK